MPDHVLESRITLARPRPEVFAFFADPGHLARIMPPWLRLTLVTPHATLSAGLVLDYRLRWLGLPLRWRSFVREFDPPYRFVDVQVAGPCRRWDHRHRFLEVDTGTLVEDRIVYMLPAGPLGRAVHAAFVGRQLAAAWRYRTARLAELIGPLAPTPVPGPA